MPKDYVLDLLTQKTAEVETLKKRIAELERVNAEQGYQIVQLEAETEAQGVSLEECRQQLVKYATLREAIKKLLPTLEYNCPPTVLADIYAALAD